MRIQIYVATIRCDSGAASGGGVGSSGGRVGISGGDGGSTRRRRTNEVTRWHGVCMRIGSSGAIVIEEARLHYGSTMMHLLLLQMLLLLLH